MKNEARSRTLKKRLISNAARGSRRTTSPQSPPPDRGAETANAWYSPLRAAPAPPAGASTVSGTSNGASAVERVPMALSRPSRIASRSSTLASSEHADLRERRDPLPTGAATRRSSVERPSAST